MTLKPKLGKEFVCPTSNLLKIVGKYITRLEFRKGKQRKSKSKDFIVSFSFSDKVQSTKVD
jgi:hypothetical protein